LLGSLAALFFAGCSRNPQPSGNLTPASPANTPSNQTVTPVTDKWLGRWQGVEGAYLSLSKNGNDYLIEIANLDGPKKYEGKTVGDHIEFQRGDKVESIRAATGKETGMKYLAEEENCLVVSVGSEGFCRK
jgi:hypothetical protein